MINSLCGSMGVLKSAETSSCSKSLPPPSPTTSVSESNVVASSEIEHTNHNNNNNNNPNNFQSLKFDDLDVEVQSPDSSIWDTLFGDQIDASTDFMLLSSPRRDFMVSSPKRDYMVSSPKGDYMVSSPKRDYMVSSPKREYMVTMSSPKRTSMSTMTTSIYSHNYGYVHGGVQGYGGGGGSSSSSKGKSQSPLHKVFNSSTSLPSSSLCSNYVSTLQGESLALPAIDAFLDEYNDCSTEAFEMAAAVPGMTATLLECLSMPSVSARYGDGGMVGDTMGVGLQMSDGHHGYGINHHHDHHQHQEHHHHHHQHVIEARDEGIENEGLMGVHAAMGVNAKVEMVDGNGYHGLLGPVACETQEQEQEQDQDSGLQLVHLLLACAESVAKDDYLSARRFLHHLTRIVSPLGDSMQRVACCFADALSARLSPPPLPSHPLLPPPPSLDVLKIYQILYQACPYIKFAHFTANQAIFEAFDAEDRVHIIDLDIVQGYQWPAFLQALAARPNGPPSLRITGVGYPAESVRETGRHLAELAHSLRIPFEFHPAVASRLQDLRPHMLHRRVGEALAVNSVNRLHRVPGSHLGNLLAMIRDQAPNIVTLVEQEAGHNGPHFLGRFLEALHYYSAIFDSLDATFPADSAARAKVEQYIFAPEIRNIVACEGAERMERHERLEKWRKVLEGKGFKGVALSQNAVTQSKILLSLYSCGDGYRLTEDNGCLLLGWQDRAILAASAWRC